MGRASQREFAELIQAWAAVRRIEAVINAAAEALNLTQKGFKSNNCFEILMPNTTATVAEVNKATNQEYFCKGQPTSPFSPLYHSKLYVNKRS